MPKFKLRFYGRLVFTDTQAGNNVTVLSLDMQANAAVGADPHRFAMSVKRRLVDLPGTTEPIERMVMAGVELAAEAEHAVWNLEGHDLSIDGQGGFSWSDKTMLSDLKELTGGAGVFDDQHLNAGATRVVNGSILLNSGVGTAEQITNNTHYDLVSRRDPANVVIPNRKLADLVDVAITTPGKLLIRLTNRSTGNATAITVSGDNPLTPIVTFSNLCTQPTRRLDSEFAGLYEVLSNAPPVEDRLVPKVRPVADGTIDCYTPAFIRR